MSYLFVFFAWAAQHTSPPKPAKLLRTRLRNAQSDAGSQSLQEHPTSIFGKYLFGRRFEMQNLRNIFCKISCLPTSPRILESLKNGIIAHF